MAQEVLVIDNPLQTMAKGNGNGNGDASFGDVQTMSIMDSMIEIFTDMRDGINRMADNVGALVTALTPSGRDLGIAGADVGPKKDKEKGGGFGGMLASLKGIFGKLDPRDMGGLMKTFLLMSGLALLFKYSDQISAALEPVLKLAKKFWTSLSPEGQIFVGVTALAAILFPKLLMTLITTGLKVAWTALTTAFTLMETFLFKTMPKAIKNAYGGAKGFLIKALKMTKDAFFAMKMFLFKTMPTAIVNAYGGAKGFVITALTKVKTAFQAMQAFLLTKLIPGIMSGFGAIGSKVRAVWTTTLTALKVAFAAVRLFLVGSLIPAMTSILIPFAPVILLVAGAVLVIGSIWQAFKDFKAHLDEGGSLIGGLATFVGSFAANILALPLDWIKSAIAWIAGLLGFEGIKETLNSFSFVDLLKNAFSFLFQKVADFITGMFDFDFAGFFSSVGNIAKRIAGTLEAVAKGAVAALAAALPGGVTPQEAFKKKFDEVMAGNVEDDEVSKIDAGANAPGEEMATADVYRSAREHLYGEGGIYSKAEWDALASSKQNNEMSRIGMKIRTGELALIPEKISTQQDTNQLIEQSQAMKDLKAKQEADKAHGRMNMPVTSIVTDNSVKDESTQIIPLQQENDDYTQRALMSYATRFSGLGRGLVGF